MIVPRPVGLVVRRGGLSTAGCSFPQNHSKFDSIISESTSDGYGDQSDQSTKEWNRSSMSSNSDGSDGWAQDPLQTVAQLLAPTMPATFWQKQTMPAMQRQAAAKPRGPQMLSVGPGPAQPHPAVAHSTRMLQSWKHMHPRTKMHGWDIDGPSDAIPASDPSDFAAAWNAAANVADWKCEDPKPRKRNQKTNKGLVQAPAPVNMHEDVGRKTNGRESLEAVGRDGRMAVPPHLYSPPLAHPPLEAHVAPPLESHVPLTQLMRKSPLQHKLPPGLTAAPVRMQPERQELTPDLQEYLDFVIAAVVEQAQFQTSASTHPDLADGGDSPKKVFVPSLMPQCPLQSDMPCKKRLPDWGY